MRRPLRRLSPLLLLLLFPCEQRAGQRCMARSGSRGFLVCFFLRIGLPRLLRRLLPIAFPLPWLSPSLRLLPSPLLLLSPSPRLLRWLLPSALLSLSLFSLRFAFP
jgi:hypothetical protein